MRIIAPELPRARRKRPPERDSDSSPSASGTRAVTVSRGPSSAPMISSRPGAKARRAVVARPALFDETVPSRRPHHSDGVKFAANTRFRLPRRWALAPIKRIVRSERMTTPNATSSPNDPSAADQARAKASEATEQAKDRAQQAAGQAQEKAQEAAGKARGVLRTQVDQRSTQAGEQTMTAANDVRSVGQQLREQGKEGPAKIADQAADRVERVGSYLRDSDADGILGDVEDFGRRNPWAIALGGLALGFAASRMLKASSSDRYQAGRSQYGGTPSYPTGNGMGTPASRTPDADVGG